MTKYGRAHRKIRDEYAAMSEVKCWLCGDPIDMSLPRTDPNSFELEDKLPLSRYPHLAADPSNKAPSHKSCNRSKGKGRPKPGLTHTSRDWSKGGQ